LGYVVCLLDVGRIISLATSETYMYSDWTLYKEYKVLGRYTVHCPRERSAINTQTISTYTEAAQWAAP